MADPCRCVSYNQPEPYQSVPQVLLDVPEWAGSERKNIAVDACIAPVIRALWQARIWTLGCCCGHNKPSRSVIVDRSDRKGAARIIRAMGDDAKVLAWELVEGDSSPTPRAEQLARMAHFGQLEPVTGDEYILHVERVVAMVDDPDAQEVAWLHDVVEDFNGFAADPDRKLALLGIRPDIIAAVLLLTRGWHDPINVPYDRYIERIAASRNPLAIAVKIADLRDHLRPTCPAERRPRYEAALARLEAG